MDVLAIAGSARRNGNSEKMLDVFVNELTSNTSDWHVEKVVLIDGSKVSRRAEETGLLKGLDIHRYSNGESSVNEYVWNIRPVSYTHLDVYKRQVQGQSNDPCT